MHTICQRIDDLAKTVMESEDIKLIDSIEHLGALAVQSQGEAFERYVTLHANLRNTIEIDHDCVEVLNSEAKEAMVQVQELRLRVEVWCKSKHRGLVRCAGLQPSGHFCNKAPSGESEYCEDHNSFYGRCLYGVEVSDGDYSSDVRCQQPVGTDDSGVTQQFCTTHMAEIDHVCRDIAEALEQSQESLKMILDQIRYFFRQNPFSQPAKPAEIPDNDRCVICLEPLNAPHDSHQAHKLLCGHIFHGGDIESDACLAGFFKTSDEFGTFLNSTCPLCRWPVFANGRLCKEGPQIAQDTAPSSTEAQANVDDGELCSSEADTDDDEDSVTEDETGIIDQSSDSSDDDMASEYMPSDGEESGPDADVENSEDDEPIQEGGMTVEQDASPIEDVGETISFMTADAIDGFLVDAGEFVEVDDSDVEMLD